MNTFELFKTLRARDPFKTEDLRLCLFHNDVTYAPLRVSSLTAGYERISASSEPLPYYTQVNARIALYKGNDELFFGYLKRAGSIGDIVGIDLSFHDGSREAPKQIPERDRMLAMG